VIRYSTDKPNHNVLPIFTGVTALANAIPDMGAILSVNLLKNGIDVDQANDFVGILKDHPTLKSLCGNNGKETELDMRGKMNGAGDAIMLIAEVVNNGALTSLDVSHNNIGQLVLPEGWSEKTGLFGVDGYTHTDGREQKENPGKPYGVIAIANVIPNIGALTSLNLADNRLCGTWTGKFSSSEGTFNLSGMFSVHASFNGD
jgi:hypothetical protein